MRLIDADALFKEEREEYRNNAENISTDYKHIFAEIDDMPTVCDIEQIRAEIGGIEINGQIDEHTSFIRTGEQVKQMALEIISKFTKGE